MPDHVRSLDRITIPTPCDADWDSMVGNDQVRFCEHCKLHVTDLTTMTRSDAMRLVARSKGRLCVRYVQKPDGGVLTKQIPEKLHRISKRVSRIAAGAFTAALSVSSAAAQTRSEANPSTLRLITSNAEPLSHPELGVSLSGVISDPNGAVISGATLTLINSQNHRAFTYTTSDDGAYKFSLLEAGVYSLVAEAPSFAQTELSQLVLTATANRTENLTMNLPQVTAEVSVIASVEVRQVALGGTVAVAEPQEPLVKAAFNNDVVAVRDLVFASLDVDARDDSTGMTALAYAVEHGNREIVQLLLAAGANINAKNRDGQTALMHVSTNATVELVRDMFAAGAEINARDESGDTPLMRAAASCSLDVVKELISDGANTDAKNNDGRTVLMNAAENEDPGVIALLIKAGADVKAKDGSEQTALTIAARWGKAATVKELIDAHAEIDAKDSDGKSALMFAASNDEPEIARLLIQAGAKVNAKDDDEKTALMFAAEQGNEVTTKALLDAGAEINAKDENGQTALMHAAGNGKLENVRVLLAAGADLSVKDNDGKTALSLALENDKEEIVTLLKSRGAPE